MARFAFALDQTYVWKWAAQVGAITEQTTLAAKAALADTVKQAEAHAIEMATNRLHTTVQKWTNAFEGVKELVPGEHWQIVLGAEADPLENGYSAYDMRQAVFKNWKGKRSKEGNYAYLIVPFEHRVNAPDRSAAQVVQFGSDLNRAKGFHEFSAQKMTKGDLAKDLQGLLKAFGSTKPFKVDKTPVVGKIWSMQKSEFGPTWTQTMAGGKEQHHVFTQGRAPSSLLSGLVRYQVSAGKRKGVPQVRSHFMTFRTMSENPKSKSKWRHPGYRGAQIMKDLETWLYDEVTKKLRDIFTRS